MVEPTPLKNMLVILDHFPKDRDENNKYLSCHQPDELGSMVGFCWHLVTGYIVAATSSDRPADLDIGIEIRVFELYDMIIYDIRMFPKIVVPPNHPF